MIHLDVAAPSTALCKKVDSLRSPFEFTAVFEAASAARSGSASARAFRRSADGPARLGLIVPKRKTKSSPRRNAFKRVAREAVRALVRDDSRASGVDFVVQFAGLPEARLGCVL